MQTLSILVPVYNEAGYIKRCLENIVNESLPNWKKEVIVVNDGSTDETLQEIKEFEKEFGSIKVISTSNRGKGAAVKTAAQVATGDVLIIQDADLEYDPHDYHRILQEYEDNNNVVVYGSRILGARLYRSYHSHVLFYIGGLLLTQIVNLLFATNLTDQSTCYKSWRSSLTQELLASCPSTGFNFEIEMTAFFATQTSIVEVPIHYYPRALHHGKKIGVSDFLSSVFTAFKYRFTRIS